MLCASLLNVRGLRTKNGSKFYVRFRCGSETALSSGLRPSAAVQPSSGPINLQWPQAESIVFGSDSSVNSDASVLVEVVVHPHRPGKERVLALGSIPLLPLWEQRALQEGSAQLPSITSWYPLYAPSTHGNAASLTSLGELRVCLRAMAALPARESRGDRAAPGIDTDGAPLSTDEVSLRRSLRPNCLRVSVHGSRGLVEPTLPSLATCARVSLCTNVTGQGLRHVDQRTSVSASTEPVWEETFLYSYSSSGPSPPTTSDKPSYALSQHCLSLTVEHVPSATFVSGSSAPTELGTVSLPLEDVEAAVRAVPARRWLPLCSPTTGAFDRRRGEVDVTMSWDQLPVSHPLLPAPGKVKKLSGPEDMIAYRAAVEGELQHARVHLSLSASNSGHDDAHRRGIDLASPTAGHDTDTEGIDVVVVDSDSRGLVDNEVVEAGESGVGGGGKAGGVNSKVKALEGALATPMRAGDYQFIVTIHEARGLKPADANGTSDPLVYMTLSPQTDSCPWPVYKQNTRIIKNRNNPVWEQTFIFSLPACIPEVLEESTVTLSVYDADTLTANDVIGSHTLDLALIYASPGHELYKQWLALVDETSGSSAGGMTGVLKASLCLLGPGDRPVAHDEKDDLGLPGQGQGEEEALAAMGMNTLAVTAASGASAEEDEDAGPSLPPEVAAAVLVPPMLARSVKYLILTFYSADGLPSMDYISGIDAFVRVQFGPSSATPSSCPKTPWVSVRGRGALSVDWNCELSIPVLCPTFSDTITISLWDYDRLTTNDLVACSSALRFSDLQETASRRRKGVGKTRGPLMPVFFPLYGAQHGLEASSKAGKAMSKYGGTMGSHYKGRILLAARIADEEHSSARQRQSSMSLKSQGRGPNGKGQGKDRFSKRTVAALPRELMPAHATYLFRALLVQGEDLPSGSALTSAPLGVMLAVGDKCVFSGRVRPVQGQAQWAVILEMAVDLPLFLLHHDSIESGRSDAPSPASLLAGDRFGGFTSPLPDTFVYLYKGDPGPLSPGKLYGCCSSSSDGPLGPSGTSATGHAVQCVSFARLPTAQLFLPAGDKAGTLQWVELQENTALNALSDSEKPGSLLLRMAIGSAASVLEQTLEWEDDCRALQGAPSALASPAKGKTESAPGVPYELRVLVFRGAELPAADDDGSLDPYVRVRFNGASVRSKWLPKTTSPGWYECLSIPTVLPGGTSLRYAPRVHVECWDHDDVSSDDFVSELRLDLTSPACQLLSAEAVLDAPSAPQPQWYNLTRYESGFSNDRLSSTVSHGRLLLSVQLIRKDSATQQLPKPILTPPHKDMWVEMTIVGLRSLAPAQGLNPSAPFLDINAGESTVPASTFSLGGSKSEAVVPREKRTGKYRRPTGSDPNFCERVLLPVRIPLDPLFCPSLNIYARDWRVGGLVTPTLGTTTIALDTMIPWSAAYMSSAAQLLKLKGALDHPDVSPGSSDGSLGSAGKKMKKKRDKSSKKTSKRSRSEDHSATSGSDAERGSLLSKRRITFAPTTASNSGAFANSISQGRKATGKGKAASSPYEELDADSSGAEKDFDVRLDVYTDSEGASEGQTAVMSAPVVAGAGSPGGSASGRRYLLHEDGSTAVQDGDDQAMAYMNKRQVYSAGLEDAYPETPFTVWPLMRGQRVGRGRHVWTGAHAKDTTRQVGQVKGIVRLLQSPTEAPAMDMDSLKAQPVIVRVYVLTGHNLQPKDTTGQVGKPQLFGGQSQLRSAGAGTSDPYIKISLGSTVINGRTQFVPSTLNPSFYQFYELRGSLPGPSTLTVECWDRDTLSPDDLIGKTQIDLEDRFFSSWWRELGREHQTSTRLRPVPVESRPLWNPTSTAPQGSLRLWVDILTPAQAAKYPPVRIQPPVPTDYEMRVVVWGTRDVKEAMGGKTSDLFVKLGVGGGTSRDGRGGSMVTTDTHWRCRSGRASFNYRAKFTISMPLKSATESYLTLQLYDRDVAKYNDCLGETVLNLGPQLSKAAKMNAQARMGAAALAESSDRNIGLGRSTFATGHMPMAHGVHVFETSPEVVGPDIWGRIEERRERLEKVLESARRRAERAGESDSEDSEEGDGEEEELGGGGSEEQQAAHAARKAASASKKKKAQKGKKRKARQPRDKEGEAAIRAAAVDSAGTGLGAGTVTSSGMDATALVKNALKKAAGGQPALALAASALTGSGAAPAGDKGAAAPVLASSVGGAAGDGTKDAGGAGGGDAEALLGPTDEAGAAQDTVQQLKALAGVSDIFVRPRHAQYVPLFRTEYSGTGLLQVPVGELLLSIEILPKEMADRYPAGDARTEPNAYPYLPPPLGRVSLTLNPFSLLSEVMGGRLLAALAGSGVAGLIGAGMLLGVPYLNALLSLPTQAMIALGAITLILLVACLVGCCARRLCGKKKAKPVREMDCKEFATSLQAGELEEDMDGLYAAGGSGETGAAGLN